MLAYSFVGLTAELFREAHKVSTTTPGPKPREVWASIGSCWIAAPLKALPLLLGVDNIVEVRRVMFRIGGLHRELNAAERDDAELIVGHANSQGGGRCR